MRKRARTKSRERKDVQKERGDEKERKKKENIGEKNEEGRGGDGREELLLEQAMLGEEGGQRGKMDTVVWGRLWRDI